MGVNPLELGKKIKKSYTDYLSTTFRFEDDKLMKQFSQKINEDEFIVKGPILEIVSNFVKGKSLEELIEDRVISKEFRTLNTKEYNGFNLERSLYKHQEEAIKKVVAGKNIIVSTGTGSGKTESFLLPILNYLFEQKERKELGSGVRAMILYPMNALASDQLKRLREILKNTPEITFGAYTGEVPEKHSKALEEYKALNGHEPLPNELISREEIKKNPPNILITNYSMLEYLLLRPDDNALFSGSNKENWKFLVIDEAHMYSGAKGIEISILIRRLKNEVENDKEMQFILTSASLGRGEEDFPEIAEFGTKFCDSKFYEEDIIISSRRETAHENYLTYPLGIYRETSELIRGENSTVEKFKEILNRNGIERKDSSEELKELVFEVFSRDEKVKKIKEECKVFPISLGSKNHPLFQEIPVESLVDIVEIGNFAIKDGEVLIPGRYHMFVRSLEGAVVTLKPNLEIHLIPKDSIKIGNAQYKAFELGVCQNCNKIYIVGEEGKDESGKTVIKFSKNYSEEISNKNYYLLEDEKLDEDEELEELERELYTLCAVCGRIKHKQGVGELCGCGQENYVTVTKVKSKEDTGKLHKCASCAKVSPGGSIVRKILAGNEAATSVLVDSLYRGLDRKEVDIKKVEENLDGFNLEFDLFSDLSIETKEKTYSTGKQILVFSDSRQKAAFFASYFETTYGKLLRRQIMVETLKEVGENLSQYSVKDFTEELAKNIKKYFKDKTGIEAKKMLKKP